MSVTVDQSKLVLNAFAAIFQNALLTGDIVSWKEYDGELNDRNGLNVSEQVGPRYKVTRTQNGVQDLTAGTQDSVFGSEQFKVDQTFGTSMGWGDFVKIRDIGDARESEALSNAATNLAEQIDAYVLSVAALASNNWVGNDLAGNIDDFDEFMSGYTRLKELGVSDNDLRGVMTFTDKQKLGKQVATIPNDNGASPNTLRVGFKGELGGVPTMFTQQLPILTVGSRVATAALVNGGAQGKNYKDVAVSTAPGRYMTQTLVLDGVAAAATIKAGEVFSIANVYAYDNRKQAVSGYLQQFTVVADATADGAGNVSVVIFPAIIVPAAGAIGDNAVNSANATCNVVPADNAQLTFLGTASTGYLPRMIIQKQAVVVNTCQLVLPVTGMGMRRKLSNVPLSVRMWKNSDFNTGFHGIRFDVALNANVRDRRRVVRISGATP